MRIGVLALQGAFREHSHMLAALGIAAAEVRKPEELAGLDGLIIPGGESTAIGKIARAYDLIEPIRDLGRAGLPIWGTCAGMILLARDLGPEPPHLGLMDIAVDRNAFGRQVDSFEIDLPVPALAGLAVPAGVRVGNGGNNRAAATPFHAVFIRAPRIASAGPGVEVLATLPGGAIVAAREGKLLATSFHPELTTDPRFHELFARICG